VNNTDTTVTISADDIVNTNLTSIGLANGDGYKIIPCDTLASIFGSPATTGVQGGGNATVSDTVQITFNGVTRTYFYSTTNDRWTQVALGSPDATNTPLRPYVGVMFGRLPQTPLVLTVTGNVPTIGREVPVKNSGLTLLSQYWPVDSTLASLNINSLPNWTSGATASVADTVQINTNGTTKTFFYNGTDWKQVALGTPTRNDEPVPVGSSVFLFQRGTDSGYTMFKQNLPYNL
jgi:hypothetical protein